MKKFAIAAVTAIVATVSLTSVAEARRHHDDDWGRHHNDRDWGGRHHFDDWGRPGRRHLDVIVFRPDCSTTKIVQETDFGTKVKIIKRCD
jgi:hypothetical protein